MRKVIIILFLFSFYLPANSSTKDKIILQMKLTNNLSFKIFENNNEINIFFDKKDLNLIGWQTEDIYQNLSITFISSIKKNQEIDGNIFKLPENN